MTPDSTLKLICRVVQSTEASAFIFWYHNNRMINYDLDRGINVSTEAVPLVLLACCPMVLGKFQHSINTRKNQTVASMKYGQCVSTHECVRVVAVRIRRDGICDERHMQRHQLTKPRSVLDDTIARCR
uniref:Ig-like domain-containing protein n=1 Tax=Anopheles culicifacies TaxID=139723 RepID=A0A182MSN7_9DIPT